MLLFVALSLRGHKLPRHQLPVHASQAPKWVMTMRKPAGEHAAYIMCTTWLEDEFPKKVSLVKTWEEAKALCSGVPAPPDVAAVVYGVHECSVECAVATAIEKLWDTQYFKKKLTAVDVVEISASIITAMSPTILKRKAERRVARSSTPLRKRTRAEHDASPAEEEKAGDLGVDPEALPQIMANQVVDAYEDGGSLSTATDVEDAAMKSAESAAPSYEDFCNQMVGKYELLSNSMKMINFQIMEIQNDVYVPTCIALHNVVGKTGESSGAYMERVKAIIAQLGFSKEADNIHSVTSHSIITTCVRFKDARAAQFLLSASSHFSPEFWVKKSGGSNIIKNMSDLKNSCIKACKKAKLEHIMKQNGSMHISRWIRMTSMRPTAPSAASAAPAAKPFTSWA